MNYSIIGKEKKLFGPYNMEKLNLFAELGKLKGNMILVDEDGNKVYASNVVASLSNHPTYGQSVPEEVVSAPEPTKQDDYVVIEPDDSPAYSGVKKSDSYVEINPEPAKSKEPLWTMIGSDGNTYGPYTKAELTSFISENRITPTTILTDEFGRQSQANSLLNFGYQAPAYSNQGYNTPTNYGGQYSQGQGFGRPRYGGNDSGTGPNAVLPMELRGLNWGAFCLGWIWGIAHKTWLSFLLFVPYLGWIMSFVLLFKGNEWAWQNRRFSSVQEFRDVERAWTVWGLVILGIQILFTIIWFIIMVSMGLSDNI